MEKWQLRNKVYMERRIQIEFKEAHCKCGSMGFYPRMGRMGHEWARMRVGGNAIVMHSNGVLSTNGTNGTRMGTN